MVMFDQDHVRYLVSMILDDLGRACMIMFYQDYVRYLVSMILDDIGRACMILYNVNVWPTYIGELPKIMKPLYVCM